MSVSVSYKKIFAFTLLYVIYAVFTGESVLAKEVFGFSIFESGSWVEEGDVTNRLDLRLFAPFGLSLRGQLADKRPAPPWERAEEGITALGAALYHKGTGSRVLYGLIETQGLFKRARNVWTHSAPWFETHTVSNADLKTSTGDMEDAATYMALFSPMLGPFTAYFSAQFDKPENAIFTGGTALRLPYASSLRLEGLITEKQLEERKMDAWFSTKTYLPSRKLRFYAATAVFSNPFFSFAGDFACSEVFAWGKDIYANAALRAGFGAWRLSLAADGAGARFMASDGSVSGAGFRSAARFEWEGRRNMLFRVSSTLRSPGWLQAFDRSESSLYFRFPVNKNIPLRINRISLSMERDAQSWEKIIDSLSLSSAFSLGYFRPSFSVTLNQHTAAKVGDTINPLPNYFIEQEFDSFKFSGDISCTILFVLLKGAMAYTQNDKQETLVTSSISASISGKLGRFTAKLSNDGKNDKLSYALSWRIQQKW
ncbi:MAG: hypothetical protein LBB22_00605 [Treponema sp.]|jgi:hypothetical protein|nr:hypothetical protein [Treponema sp.]